MIFPLINVYKNVFKFLFNQKIRFFRIPFFHLPRYAFGEYSLFSHWLQNTKIYPITSDDGFENASVPDGIKLKTAKKEKQIFMLRKKLLFKKLRKLSWELFEEKRIKYWVKESKTPHVLFLGEIVQHAKFSKFKANFS